MKELNREYIKAILIAQLESQKLDHLHSFSKIKNNNNKNYNVIYLLFILQLLIINMLIYSLYSWRFRLENK